MKPVSDTFALPARGSKPRAEVNLANVTPGQILRLEGFRRGIGRAVNYWFVSGDASRPAGIHR